MWERPSAVSPLRALVPAPIRALRWRIPWMRRTERFASSPLRTAWTATRFTLRELTSGSVTFRTEDGLVLTTMPNNFSSFALCVAGARDPAIWAFIRRRLGPGSVFVDAGANIGTYTCPAARLVGPTGRVIAFEPHPVTYGYLSRNVEANGLSQVRALHLALGEAPGQIEIVSVANPGENHVAATGEHGSGAAAVAMATLDDALAGQEIGPVDYLKIDVEGFELPVLRGARRTIAASPAIVVQTELQDQHANRYGFRIEEIASLLSELGLRPHLPHGDGHLRAADGRLRGDVLCRR
jgi:FkbM family methyltransferase